MQKKEELIKFYKTRIKILIAMGSVNSVALGIFLIFFHDPVYLIYAFLFTIILIWVFVFFQIRSVLKELKRIKKQ